MENVTHQFHYNQYIIVSNFTSGVVKLATVKSLKDASYDLCDGFTVYLGWSSGEVLRRY